MRHLNRGKTLPNALLAYKSSQIISRDLQKKSKWRKNKSELIDVNGIESRGTYSPLEKRSFAINRNTINLSFITWNAFDLTVKIQSIGKYILK